MPNPPTFMPTDGHTYSVDSEPIEIPPVDGVRCFRPGPVHFLRDGDEITAAEFSEATGFQTEHLTAA